MPNLEAFGTQLIPRAATLTEEEIAYLERVVQRYRSELSDELPEVDLFLGLTDADRLVPGLRRRGLLHDRDVPTMERPLRVLSSRTRHTSYLKISEGCDHTCAFCAIPLMRGRFRSTPADTLIAEARELAAQGVVELNIVSQDTTWYGRDVARGRMPEHGDHFVGATFAGMAGVELPVAAGASPARAAAAADDVHPASLDALLRRLLDETDVPWLRLFYMYPSGISRGLGLAEGLPGSGLAMGLTLKQFRIVSISPTEETAKAAMRALRKIDVTPLMPKVQAPTLVLHRSGLAAITVEMAKEIAQDRNVGAGLIEGTSFVLGAQVLAYFFN